jgi:hypothetical protein
LISDFRFLIFNSQFSIPSSPNRDSTGGGGGREGAGIEK